MNLLGTIIFIYYMLYSSAATTPTVQTRIPYLARYTKWNQSLLVTMEWIPQPNNREIFYDILTTDKSHDMAILEWNPPIDDSHPGGFNLSISYHNLNGRDPDFRYPCLIPAGDDIESLFLVKIVYLRTDRVLVYLKKNHKIKGMMQIPLVVNPKTCKIEEGIDMEPYVGFSTISVVPFKNTFDIVFYNQTLCPDNWWCKMTFDHDGKKVSGPTSLFKVKFSENMMYIDGVYPMNYESDKEGYVFVSEKRDLSDRSVIYSPVRGWLPADDLKESNYAYSNTSGRATLCWQDKQLKNIKCTWLDDTHKDDSTTTITLNDRTMFMPYICNTPGGRIAMLKEGLENGKKVIFSDTAQQNGKCKRYMTSKFDGELKRIELSIIDEDKSCISFVTRDPKPVSQQVYSATYTYTFTTECVKFSKDFVPENITCGKDYIFV